MRQGQRDIWIIYPGLGDHVSLASSVATSCKRSHSSGVSTVINLKTAKQIGLTIPPNVLVRADKVIR